MATGAVGVHRGPANGALIAAHGCAQRLFRIDPAPHRGLSEREDLVSDLFRLHGLRR